MKSNPLVTVIIPTYNYGRYICEAIDSVLGSSMPQHDIEIVVIDDGSTDDTLNKVQTYRDRVEYVFQENQGKASATKVGIERGIGRYIFNLDADDLFLREKIEEVVNVFESDREVIHVGHPALCWDVAAGTRTSEQLPAWLVGRKTSGKEVLLEFYKNRILFGGGSTFAARSEFLKCCSISREIDMYIDEYLILAALDKGYSYFIEHPLSVWRMHGENYSDADMQNKCSSLARKKDERSQDSMNAVLEAVLSGDFEPDIKMLYMLKTKVSRITMSERAGNKSYVEVLDLWTQLISTFRLFGKESFKMMRRYRVLNRTLPTPVLKLAKRSLNRGV